MDSSNNSYYANGVPASQEFGFDALGQQLDFDWPSGPSQIDDALLFPPSTSLTPTSTIAVQTDSLTTTSVGTQTDLSSSRSVEVQTNCSQFNGPQNSLKPSSTDVLVLSPIDAQAENRQLYKIVAVGGCGDDGGDESSPKRILLESSVHDDKSSSEHILDNESASEGSNTIAEAVNEGIVEKGEPSKPLKAPTYDDEQPADDREQPADDQSPTALCSGGSVTRSRSNRSNTTNDNLKKINNIGETGLSQEITEIVEKFMASRNFAEEHEHMVHMICLMLCDEMVNRDDHVQFFGIVPISELQSDPNKFYKQDFFSVIVDFCTDDSLDRDLLRSMDITKHDRNVYIVLVGSPDRITRFTVSRAVFGENALKTFLDNSNRRVKHVAKFSKILPSNSMYDGLLAVLLICYYNSPSRRMKLRFSDRRSINNQMLILLHLAMLEKEIKQE